MSTNVTVDLMQILCSNVMQYVQLYTLPLNQSQRTNTVHNSCHNMFLKQHSLKMTIKKWVKTCWYNNKWLLILQLVCMV